MFSISSLESNNVYPTKINCSKALKSVFEKQIVTRFPKFFSYFFVKRGIESSIPRLNSIAHVTKPFRNRKKRELRDVSCFYLSYLYFTLARAHCDAGFVIGVLGLAFAALGLLAML
jgi:hypothetical protein